MQVWRRVYKPSLSHDACPILSEEEIQAREAEREAIAEQVDREMRANKWKREKRDKKALEEIEKREKKERERVIYI